MSYITLTVEQLDTLALRARERGASKTTVYLLGDEMLVEVWRSPEDRWEDGPREATIGVDGRVRVEVQA